MANFTAQKGNFFIENAFMSHMKIYLQLSSFFVKYFSVYSISGFLFRFFGIRIVRLYRPGRSCPQQTNVQLFLLLFGTTTRSG